MAKPFLGDSEPTPDDAGARESDETVEPVTEKGIAWGVYDGQWIVGVSPNRLVAEEKLKDFIRHYRPAKLVRMAIAPTNPPSEEVSGEPGEDWGGRLLVFLGTVGGSTPYDHEWAREARWLAEYAPFRNRRKMMADKVKVWRLEHKGSGSFLAVDHSGLDGINEEIRQAEDGDVFTVTVEYWEQKSFNELPEWDGW